MFGGFKATYLLEHHGICASFERGARARKLFYNSHQAAPTSPFQVKRWKGGGGRVVRVIRQLQCRLSIKHYIRMIGMSNTDTPQLHVALVLLAEATTASAGCSFWLEQDKSV